MEIKQFSTIITKCLSPLQYVAGSDRKIHSGIARARDAIHAAGLSKTGCGIADTDFMAAFDWFMCHTVDLRVLDISSISSKVKSWIFQDQLEKPQEMILHRPIDIGGLGLHNGSIKLLHP